MRRKYWWKPQIRERTAEELGQLVHLSHTESRAWQCDYLETLGGEGSFDELDYILSVARNNDDALMMAKQLDRERDAQRFPGGSRLSKGVCDAVNFSAHKAICGDFGPDYSRDGRSAAFLKHNHVIPTAVAIFMQHLLIDVEGNVLNHDDAEERGAEYIRHHC